MMSGKKNTRLRYRNDQNVEFADTGRILEGFLENRELGAISIQRPNIELGENHVTSITQKIPPKDHYPYVSEILYSGDQIQGAISIQRHYRGWRSRYHFRALQDVLLFR